jgi:uncharacterized protein YndB with AHSA1/START domain
VPVVIACSVTVDRPVDRVFRYLSDFTTTNEDPGTVRTTREEGDGGAGTRYRNVVRSLGRETELTYVVEELAPNRRVSLRGGNNAVLAHDVMTFMSTPSGGTAVSYRAEFELRDPYSSMAPLLAPLFGRLGGDADTGLRRALERL